MRSEDKVKAAIVGCGAISEIYLSNLAGPQRKFQVIDVVACCDMRVEAAQAKAETYGLKVMTLDEICNDSRIELVINLTTPGAHYPVIKQLLLAGKHVYTEKILAIHLQEAQELVALAAEKNLYLGVAPDTFLGSSVQTARQIVDSGLIGEVSSCYAALNRDYNLMPEHVPFVSKLGGGIGFDVGIYYVTALLSILGPVKSVCGFIKTNRPDRQHFLPARDNFGEEYHVESENLMVGSLMFESGIVGTLHFNSESIMNEKAQLVIYGTEGILYMGNPDQFGGDVKLLRKGQTEPVVIPANHGYGDNCRGLGVAEMAWAMKQGRKNRANKEMALNALETLHGIAISSETKQFYELESTFEIQPSLPQGFLGGEYYGCNSEASLI